MRKRPLAFAVSPSLPNRCRDTAGAPGTRGSRRDTSHHRGGGKGPLDGQSAADPVDRGAGHAARRLGRLPARLRQGADRRELHLLHLLYGDHRRRGDHRQSRPQPDRRAPRRTHRPQDRTGHQEPARAAAGDPQSDRRKPRGRCPATRSCGDAAAQAGSLAGGRRAGGHRAARRSRQRAGDRPDRHLSAGRPACTHPGSGRALWRDPRAAVRRDRRAGPGCHRAAAPAL